MSICGLMESIRIRANGYSLNYYYYYFVIEPNFPLENLLAKKKNKNKKQNDTIQTIDSIRHVIIFSFLYIF